MKFSTLKEKISVVQKSRNNSIVITILFMLSIVLGIILSIMSIPIRVIIIIGTQITNILAMLLLLGSLLGFFFTPYISIFKLLWILFCVGCLSILPSVILSVIDYIIELLLTWVLIFKK